MPRVCATCGRKFDGNVTRCPDDGSPTLVFAPEDDIIGKTLDGRFTVRDLLGKGGMGAVYRAHQHSMDRDVALKVLRRDMAHSEDAVKRFFREARAVSKLASPHTIVVHDFGQTEEGLLYIAMDLLRGRSLAQVLRALERPMEPAKAVRIAEQILESLAEAHQVGIIHRDLKPDNVFILEGTGRNEFVKVLDFGIAKLTGADGTGSHLTGTGLAFGTPTYMSPEQAQAKGLDPRTDLYSLGVILFEMLAGRPPFEGETPLDVMMKKVQGQPPSVFHVNPDVRVPVRLERLLASLLAKDKDARPSSAEMVTRLLAEVMEESSAELVPIPDVVTVQGSTTQVVKVVPDATVARAPEPATSPLPAITTTASKEFMASRESMASKESNASQESAQFPGLLPGQRAIPWKWIGLAAVVLAAIAIVAVMAGGGGPPEQANIKDVVAPAVIKPIAPSAVMPIAPPAVIKPVLPPVTPAAPVAAPQPAAAAAEAPVAEPVVAKPVVAAPAVAEPVVAKPVVAEPVVAQPVVAKPKPPAVPVVNTPDAPAVADPRAAKKPDAPSRQVKRAAPIAPKPIKKKFNLLD